MKKQILTLFIISALFLSFGFVAASTVVPGQQNKTDLDNNGYPDAGVYVNGHYKYTLGYDIYGGLYWDTGNGEGYGTVSSMQDLDQATLTTCDAVINYKADFGNDAGMDQGWMQTHMTCRGYSDNSHYNYLIVSDKDPRYTGNPNLSTNGNWEYHIYSKSGSGNLIKSIKDFHI